ncbi:MAG: BrnT family toxin [Gammaproteobacteria bacterium]|nr:BrnT family toxin [Gammaproteobacteria bacterium]
MEFEWDESKRQSNLRRHHVDFADAEELFQGPMLTSLDEREEYGEDRWIGIGQAQGRARVVVFTERGVGKVIRIISMRKALSHERKAYEKVLNELGAG